MYRHLLIATDGSAVAQKGVDNGLALAKQLGAKVTVVTVSEVITGNVLAGQSEIGIFTRTEELERAAEEAAQKILAAVGEQARLAGVAAETVHLRKTMPSKGILETPRAAAATLSSWARTGGRASRGSSSAARRWKSSPARRCLCWW